MALSGPDFLCDEPQIIKKCDCTKLKDEIVELNGQLKILQEDNEELKEMVEEKEYEIDSANIVSFKTYLSMDNKELKEILKAKGLEMDSFNFKSAIQILFCDLFPEE